MKITDCYPQEPFDSGQQLEWARAVVERLRAYSAAQQQE